MQVLLFDLCYKTNKFNQVVYIFRKLLLQWHFNKI
jgi:hypothetical protein